MEAQSQSIEPKPDFTPHRVDPLLSLREAGRLVGVSHTCIGRWIDKGVIRAVGGAATHRRVRRSELIKLCGEMKGK